MLSNRLNSEPSIFLSYHFKAKIKDLEYIFQNNNPNFLNNTKSHYVWSYVEILVWHRRDLEVLALKKYPNKVYFYKTQELSLSGKI